MKPTNRNIILMGYSEIGERFAEMQHGKFETVKEAEIFGLGKIKSVRWRVANSVIRTKDNGELERTYEWLSDVYEPRDNLPRA